MKLKHMIDLTHSLNSKVPTWDGACGFQLKGKEIIIHTSTGTHIDAPAYFSKTGCTVATLPLEQLVVPACVIDLSQTATEETVIFPKDIENFETLRGKIPENSLVIAYTGWSRRWPNTKAYRNELKFPVFGIEAIELLLKRKIAGVAIDTLALEKLGGSYPGHKLLMEAGKYIIENIANCDQLPPTGAYVVALPLKIEKGEECPIRVIALIPR